MARPERREAECGPVPVPPTGGGSQFGGEVGRMQASLAQRLSLGQEEALASVENGWPGERAVRSVSIAGGYLALGAAYVGMVVLIGVIPR